MKPVSAWTTLSILSTTSDTIEKVTQMSRFYLKNLFYTISNRHLLWIEASHINTFSLRLFDCIIDKNISGALAISEQVQNPDGIIKTNLD